MNVVTKAATLRLVQRPCSASRFCMLPRAIWFAAANLVMSCRYKLVGGPCPASYGLNVARLAGIPSSVLKVGNASAWMWLESMQPSHVLCGSQRATEKRDEAAATSKHEHA